jgi:hypothetical protein
MTSVFLLRQHFDKRIDSSLQRFSFIKIEIIPLQQTCLISFLCEEDPAGMAVSLQLSRASVAILHLFLPVSPWVFICPHFLVITPSASACSSKASDLWEPGHQGELKCGCHSGRGQSTTRGLSPRLCLLRTDFSRDIAFAGCWRIAVGKASLFKIH